MKFTEAQLKLDVAPLSDRIHCYLPGWEKAMNRPEQGGGKPIPEGMCNPRQVYTVSRGKSGTLGVYRLKSQILPDRNVVEAWGSFVNLNYLIWVAILELIFIENLLMLMRMAS